MSNLKVHYLNHMLHSTFFWIFCPKLRFQLIISVHFFYFQELSRQIYLWRWSNIYITQEIERNRNFISLKIRQFVSLFTSGEIVWRGENAETISVHANYFVHSSMYFFVVCGFGMKLWLLFLNVLLFSFRLHICIEF